MNQTLFLIFFVYGLSFFCMGLAMAMEAGRSSALAEARVLTPLAGFGLIHGTHEWLESYLLQASSLGTPLPNWLPWLRLGLLIGSFLSLLVFAFQALRLVKRPLRRDHRIMAAMLAGYFVFILLSAALTYQQGQVPWSNVVDALARYLLAVPASMLAAMGLRARSLQTRTFNNKLGSNLNIAAISFVLYALTQLFVHPISMFPANRVNEELFLAALGFPIQGLRALTALGITIGLLRATHVVDEIRQDELFAAQKERLAALEEQESLRRELLQHTVRAQEDERARVARELHDDTAQTLSAFTLELAIMRNEKLRKSEMKQTVERLETLAREMSRSIYRLVYDLRPSQLDDLGLVPALRSLCEEKCRKYELQLEFNVSGPSRRLNPLVETALFRIGQEALKNLAQHSGVRQGRVEIVYSEKDITLRVVDRGCGFDPEANFHPPHGWGLAGMKERVEAVAGTLRIDSATGKGTTVEVCVPIDGKVTA